MSVPVCIRPRGYVIGIRRTSPASKVYLRAVLCRAANKKPECTASLGPQPEVRSFNPEREYLIPIPAGAPTKAVEAYRKQHGSSSDKPYFFSDAGQKGIEEANAKIGLLLADPRPF